MNPKDFFYNAKVSFVRIDPADWKLPCDNQSMSNLVFSVSLYILVVLRFTIFFRMAGLQCLMNLVSIELLSPSELLEVDPIMS